MRMQQDAQIVYHLRTEASEFKKQIDSISTLLAQYYQILYQQKIVNIDDPLTNQERYYITQAINSLADVQSSFLEREALLAADVMVYFTKSHIAISNTTMYTLNNLCSIYFIADLYVFEESLESFLQSGYSQQILMLNGINKRYPLLMRRFQLMGSKDKIIGMGVLNENMFSFDAFFEGTVYIATSGGGLFGDQTEGMPSFRELEVQETTVPVTINQNTYLMMATNVASGYKLAIAIPKASYMRNINIMSALVIGIIAALGAVGAFVLQQAQRRYNTHLRSISKLLHAAESEETSSSNSIDFNLICLSLSHLVEQNGDLQQQKVQVRKQIESNYAPMRSSFVRMLILGKVDTVDMQDMLRFYQIDTSYDRCRILLFQIDSHSITLEEADKVRQIVVVSISSVLDCWYETYIVDDYTVGVLFMYNINDRPNFGSEIRKQARHISEVMREKMNIRVTIGMGRSVETLDNLQYAYFSARIILMCSTRTGLRELNPTDDISDDNNAQLMIILNALERGDAAQCLSVFDSMFQPMDEERNYTPQQRACALVLFNLFDDTVNGNAQLKKLFISNGTFDQQLNGCIILEDILNLIKNMMESACHCLASTSEDRIKLVINHAVQLIQQCYTDCNLSQTEIADLLGINAATLSTKFKEIVGVNMSLYLRELRVAKTKQLLQESNLTLEGIANQTGFGSLKTMYRVFKIEMGMTPGQYRESVIQHDLRRNSKS
jgi:two-component system response regulator YesN